MNKIYELVLWDAGNKILLGFFKTSAEAKTAMRLAKKYYAVGWNGLQDRIADGIAGYEIIKHEYGFVSSVAAWIEYIQERGNKCE